MTHDAPWTRNKSEFTYITWCKVLYDGSNPKSAQQESPNIISLAGVFELISCQRPHIPMGFHRSYDEISSLQLMNLHNQRQVFASSRKHVVTHLIYTDAIRSSSEPVDSRSIEYGYKVSVPGTKSKKNVNFNCPRIKIIHDYSSGTPLYESGRPP